MLRTHQSFLAYMAQLYEEQQRKEDIIVKTFKKGSKLLEQGSGITKVMLIKDGITKCFVKEENDKDFILEFLGKGEIIGEIELLQHIPCLCNIEAMTDVTVYALSVPYFRSLLTKDFGFNNLLLEVFSKRIVNTSSRASYQQLYTTEHSLSRLLTLQDQLGTPMNKEDMAAYLGITIRSLNRALKQLEDHKK
ncbi:Crp/Fnr family transcriptional regulator [Elizabethkingia anophelis]|uniref:DNA-binding transcriptional activator YeiL n=1 Tax=Elizabethkingia anophelis TaxID=1117645 RepID=A0A7Z7PY58_9FLAO|nr:Crp/Fnr family transcriptional regulator [Elizabethkingia anophelis]MCT3628972.1 Crp/Fnr family transcriptional regulator [Elizabethkingia anophelis]MCT3632089.1 Crp/Fnr family transcriptional regulator [Elizabethkingia anophelis]MCT3671832.1 Crp/Fnr family transcriptional regulator [Elizabethkingia anophelis]MCT3679197.1 Crp/Fnr family transcriptional regulator [Elizabethkingia anophelis]MCT3690405.1 Crp/Fnr family transcriptional regulator [Elizabethkingia anophelis]